MATRASIFLLPLLLLAALASASIENVCRKASTRDKLINYGFCVMSLRGVPGSSSANDSGLAAIAGNLASQQAQATLPKIDDLLKHASPSEKGPLEDCRELYGDAVQDLKAAADYAKKMRYPDANSHFSAGMDGATTCERGFSEEKVKSPLAAEDNKLFQLGAIGASITYTGP